MWQWLLVDSAPAWWWIGLFLVVVFGVDQLARWWRTNAWRRRHDDDDDPPLMA